MATTTLNFRAIAMLRAVAAGRAEVTCSCEPDLYVDGVACCDQFTAHTLAHHDLVRAARLGAIGQRVPAVLTAAGHAVIDSMTTAAAA